MGAHLNCHVPSPPVLRPRLPGGERRGRTGGNPAGQALEGALRAPGGGTGSQGLTGRPASGDEGHRTPHGARPGPWERCWRCPACAGFWPGFTPVSSRRSSPGRGRWLNSPRPSGVEVFRWVQGLAPEPTTAEGRLKAWLERRASRRRSGRFIASDEGVVETVRQRYRVDDVVVVHQALDLGKIRSRVEAVTIRDARVRLGLSEGQRAVVAVSDFQDRSRMYQLLEGFATARTEEPSLRLFVVGRGPEEGSARGYAEDLRLEDSVIFLGSDPSRPSLLRVAEVVVDAGAWPGWAQASVEAMAMPLPVLRWVDGDDDPGAQRYPARTTGPANRFARDVLDLLEDGKPRTEAARRSAELASAYSVATVADRWAEIYAE